MWVPLALGATGEWTRLGLEATVALAVILWAAAGGGSAWSITLPMVLLGGVFVQLLPLSDRVLTAIAARRLFLGAALVAAVADVARIVIRRAKTGRLSAPKTGHHVGGIGRKDRLVRTCWQGVGVSS